MLRSCCRRDSLNSAKAPGRGGGTASASSLRITGEGTLLVSVEHNIGDGRTYRAELSTISVVGASEGSSDGNAGWA
jgi:hypothetical protein